jgi:hypothetical protein
MNNLSEHRSLPVLVVLLGGLCSCATQTRFETAASQAADQLVTLQVSINAKIKAENRYYDDALRLTQEELGNWRADSRIQMLQENRAAFLQKNTNKRANKLKGNLVKLIESTISDWRKQEAERDKLQTDLNTTLAESRKKISYETGKIQALRGKLSVLGESRSNAELFKFVVSYAKEVEAVLDKFEVDADTASAAALAETKDQPDPEGE